LSINVFQQQQPGGMYCAGIAFTVPATKNQADFYMQIINEIPGIGNAALTALSCSGLF
jgi:hypothetical protein